MCDSVVSYAIYLEFVVSKCDFEKKVNDSSNYAFIKNLNIQPYEAVGQDRFIRYKAFIDEFKLYVLSRPLKALIKLNHF